MAHTGYKYLEIISRNGIHSGIKDTLAQHVFDHYSMEITTVNLTESLILNIVGRRFVMSFWIIHIFIFFLP